MSRRLMLKLFLIAIVPLAAAIPSLADERKVALVISNAAYENAPVLDNPPVDASAVARKLEEMQFEDVQLLRDASADQLRKALRDFALKARLSDVAFIYYAGHGLEADGQNYLVPVDARLETDADLIFETVGLDLALRAVNGAKKLKLLFLDACRNNPFAVRMKLEGTKTRSYATGLGPIESAGDILVSYAAEAGKVAKDGPPGENSPYAKALIDNIATPGIDVRQMLGRVRDAVQKTTQGQQRPFIYASLGGDPIYLVPPPDVPALRHGSPIVVDLQAADPNEEAIGRFLGEENTEFKFRYDLSPPRPPATTATLTPKLDYFTTAAERGRPFIVASGDRFFAPGETPGWSVSYPIIDLIARRYEHRVITLSEIVLEVQESSSDYSPQVGIGSGSGEFARLALFNEGWGDIKRATLEFEVLGFREPSSESVRELVQSKRNGGYTYRSSIGPFQDFAVISLAAELRRALPDFAMYEYAFNDRRRGMGADKAPKRAPTPPPGYATWATAHLGSSAGDEPSQGVWVAGRMIIEPTREGIEPVIADFLAPVPMFPKGPGGGFIAYNAKQPLTLRPEGASYVVRHSIGYLLDQDSRTFRGLYPLVVERTSRHRLRVILRGDGSKDLMVSDWIDAYIVVPRYSKKVADWFNAGHPMPSPLKGVRGP